MWKFLFFLLLEKYFFKHLIYEYFMYICVHVCMTEIKEEGRKNEGGKKKITKTESKQTPVQSAEVRKCQSSINNARQTQPLSHFA